MEKLKSYLKSLDGNQKTLADYLGISRPYMSLLLSGHKRPSLQLAGSIEKLTDGAVPMTAWIDDKEVSKGQKC